MSGERHNPFGSIICIRFTGYNLSHPNGRHPFAWAKISIIIKTQRAKRGYFLRGW